jgi:CHAD domain-containing protein
MPEPTGPQGAVELEVKLVAPPGFSLPDLSVLTPGMRIGRDVTLELDAVYHDTPDLRLARRGASLRRRTGEGRPRWTLKLAPDDGRAGGAEGTLVRRELDVVSDSLTVPAELGDLVTAVVRTSTLGPVAHLVTSRRQRRMVDESGIDLVEIDEDRVAVLADGTVAARFAEIEVELLRGDAELLHSVVAAMRAVGARIADPTPKVVRALGPRALAPRELAPVAVEPAAELGTVIRHALAEAAALVVDHDPVIRLGDDPEGVHRARVGTRRARAHLGLFRDVLEADPTAPLRRELRWLARELGTVRDSDVLLDRLRAGASRLDDEADRIAAGGLVGRLVGERRARTEALLDVLRGERYVLLLDDLVGIADDPPLGREARRRAGAVLPSWVRRRFVRLRRAVEELPADPGDHELHAIRILAKRVRYASEVAALVVGTDAERFARRVVAVQDLLGELQDTVVARGWLRQAAAALPTSAFVAGRLVAAEDQRSGELRSRWPDVWRRLDRPKATAWMKAR